MRGQQRERREGCATKGFLQREIRISRLQCIRLCIDSIWDFRAALLSPGRNKTLCICSFPNHTKKLEPTRKKKSQQQNSFFPLLPSQFCLFFFFHTERYFSGVFFFFESSGLKILGHLGILRASGRSRAEHREVLGRPRQRGLHWSMCLGEGGLRGAKEATYIFRRKNKNEEKKKASPRPAWRTRQHWGLGAGERGEEKGWVDGSEDPD